MKKCKSCKQPFEPWNTLQKVCSAKCALELVRADERRERRKELREYRKNDKTRSQLITEAHRQGFNPYIRYRDRYEPCISCGKYDHEIPDRFRGGKWDCGHYLTVAAHPELRFHPFASHKQCKRCNGGSGQWSKKDKSVHDEYRANLIKKIGLENVLWLEGPHKIQNLTKEDAREIKQYFKQQLKILKQEE